MKDQIIVFQNTYFGTDPSRRMQPVHFCKLVDGYGIVDIRLEQHIVKYSMPGQVFLEIRDLCVMAVLIPHAKLLQPTDRPDTVAQAITNGAYP